MKQLLGLVTMGILISFFACGPSESSEEAAAAEEAARLDSIDSEISTAIDKVEEDAEALESALDSLDNLFPEEEEQ